jgi:putative MATE family efflux protein
MRTMPVGKLLITMALPLIMSMLVQAFYNVVDSYYVSQIPGKAQSSVAALSIAFPIQHLQIGFATGVAVGVNALLSKSLGQGRQDRANQAAGNGIFLMGIAIVLFMLFGLFGAKPFFAMQSDVADTVEGGSQYISICTILCAGIFVEVMGERLLQASGRTIFTLFTQGTGAILNIVLDPIFIFGSKSLGIAPMGIAGAAVATVIGQWVAAILAVIFNLTCNKDVQFSFKSMLPRSDICRKILTVGIPSIIMMAIGSVMTFSMNQIFRSFRNLGETAVAVFGIYFKLQSFFLMPVLGLNNASVSIVAYNYGAREPKRILGNLKYALCIAMAIMLLGLAAFQIFPHVFMGIFSSGESSGLFMDLGKTALRIVSFHFPLAAVGIILSASFQALGTGIYSTIISLCRQLVVLVPAAWLLSLSGNVDLVWWAFPLAELASTTMAIFFFLRIYRKKIKPLANCG